MNIIHCYCFGNRTPVCTHTIVRSTLIYTSVKRPRLQNKYHGSLVEQILYNSNTRFSTSSYHNYVAVFQFWCVVGRAESLHVCMVGAETRQDDSYTKYPQQIHP